VIEEDRFYYLHAVKVAMTEPEKCISIEMEVHPDYTPERAIVLQRKLESGTATGQLDDSEWNLLLYAMIDEWMYSDSRDRDDGLFEAIGRLCPEAKADLERDPNRFFVKYKKVDN